MAETGQAPRNRFERACHSPLNGGNCLVALSGALWVDQDADRFCDESISMVFNMAANACACLGNKESYAVFDQAYKEGRGAKWAPKRGAYDTKHGIHDRVLLTTSTLAGSPAIERGAAAMLSQPPL